MRNALSLWNRNWEPFFEDSAWERRSFVPAADISETDKLYKVEIDVPGLKREDLSIEVKNHELVVTGKRHRVQDHPPAGSFERLFGAFERRFALPQGTEADQIEAKHENGVLEISIPKPAAIRSRQITIQ